MVALLLSAPAPTISVTHRFRQSPAEISTPSKSSRIGRPSSRPAGRPFRYGNVNGGDEEGDSLSSAVEGRTGGDRFALAVISLRFD